MPWPSRSQKLPSAQQQGFKMPAGSWGPGGRGSCLGTTPWQTARPQSLNSQTLSRRPQTQLARPGAPALTPPLLLQQWVLGPRDKDEPGARSQTWSLSPAWKSREAHQPREHRPLGGKDLSQQLSPAGESVPAENQAVRCPRKRASSSGHS